MSYPLYLHSKNISLHLGLSLLLASGSRCAAGLPLTFKKIRSRTQAYLGPAELGPKHIWVLLRPGPKTILGPTQPDPSLALS